MIQKINRLLVTLGDVDYITFLDMHDQFADPDGLPRRELMQDGVHPNAAGYRVWAETMEPVLSKLLNDQSVVPDPPDAGDAN